MIVDGSTRKDKGQRAIVDILENYGTILGLVIICAVFSFMTPAFLTRDNLLAIVAQSSAIGIISIGLTFVMITEKTDMSFGSCCGLSGMTTAFLLSRHLHPVPAILLGLCVGLIIGLVNSWLVAHLRIQSVVATISTQAIAFGLAYLYSGGVDIHDGVEAPFTLLGKGFVGPVPMPAVLLLVILAGAIFFMNYTRFGRYLYAVGGNPIAAKFSGIRVQSYEVLAYVICGVLASAAGILMVARLGYGAAYTGQGYLLDGFASVYLGCTILKRGKPNVVGSVVGALFMMILNNGFQLLNVDFVMQILAKGAALLLIVTTHSLLALKKD